MGRVAEMTDQEYLTAVMMKFYSKHNMAFLILIMQWDESNSTERPVRVEANLLWTSIACVFFYKCIIWKRLTLKIRIIVTEYDIHHGASR